jgi:hypothetical protein
VFELGAYPNTQIPHFTNQEDFLSPSYPDLKRNRNTFLITFICQKVKSYQRPTPKRRKLYVQWFWKRDKTNSNSSNRLDDDRRNGEQSQSSRCARIDWKFHTDWCTVRPVGMKQAHLLTVATTTTHTTASRQISNLKSSFSCLVYRIIR